MNRHGWPFFRGRGQRRRGLSGSRFLRAAADERACASSNRVHTRGAAGGSVAGCKRTSPRNVSGSRAVTPRNRLAIPRVSDGPARIPIAPPIMASFVPSPRVAHKTRYAARQARCERRSRESAKTLTNRTAGNLGLNKKTALYCQYRMFGIILADQRGRL